MEPRASELERPAKDTSCPVRFQLGSFTSHGRTVNRHGRLRLPASHPPEQAHCYLPTYSRKGSHTSRLKPSVSYRWGD